MKEHPEGGRGAGSRDPERALLTALRIAIIPSLFAPFACAVTAASTAGSGPPIAYVGPLAALAVAVSVTCWLRVVILWRRLPRRGDDDHGWWNWRDGDAPLDPRGGGGDGIHFDWARFERQFWAYVRELEKRTELVPVG